MTPVRIPALPRPLATALLLGAAVALLGRAARAEDAPPTPPPPAPAAPAAPADDSRPAPKPADAKPAAAPKAASAPAAGPGPEWRPGDELEVRVLSRADLTCTVRIVADGTVDVPFAGRYAVVGRTLEQLRADVEAGFSKIEREPRVAVTVTSLAPDEFYVLGEVGKAGVFTVPRTKKVTFLQALGMAGGFGPEADFTRVQIVPAAGGEPKTMDASPGRIAALASVTVADRDTIVVPSVGRIYLMGQVNRTGGFAPPAGERMTLSRAIALAGGFTRLADTSSVLVTWRDASGSTVGNRYNLKAILDGRMEDVVVYPGNLIFVPERLL
jgi:polysaccharide export outer membrane protein